MTLKSELISYLNDFRKRELLPEEAVAILDMIHEKYPISIITWDKEKWEKEGLLFMDSQEIEWTKSNGPFINLWPIAPPPES